jgi:hypothetical protein
VADAVSNAYLIIAFGVMQLLWRYEWVKLYIGSFYLIIDEELKLLETLCIFETDLVLLDTITEEPLYLLLQKYGLAFNPLHLGR